MLLEMCVGSLDHLDNCKAFGVFNIFKSMFKNGYIFLSLKRQSAVQSQCQIRDTILMVLEN
jgi:hypothetical protein